MEDDEEDTDWEVTTPKKKTKRSTTGRNKRNNLNADVAASQAEDTNEGHGEESKVNDVSESGSAQAICTPKKRDETVPYGMASMLEKLRDGMDL